MWDVDPARARNVAADLGADVAASREDALGADVVATITPGHEVVVDNGTVRPGQHLSLMGADGPGKAEVATDALVRMRLFCDDWEQASHGGELAHAVDAGAVDEGDVTQLGAVLAGEAAGRRDAAEVTAFDSTGLAIQDLAIAIVALEHARDLDLLQIEL